MDLRRADTLCLRVGGVEPEVIPQDVTVRAKHAQHLFCDGGFDISIKEEYHPEDVHEDYLIEDILQRAFASGKLERQESVLDYDYASLSNKWSASKKKAN